MREIKHKIEHQMGLGMFICLLILIGYATGRC